MPEGTSPINPTDLNTLNSSVPSPSMIPAAPKPPKPPRNLLPVVIILAVLTLAGLGTSIFFGVQNSSQSSEISDLKSQISSQNPVIVIDEEENPGTPSTPTDQPNVITKASILAEVPKNLGLANAKCLNCTTEMVYTITSSFSTFSASISPNSNTASLHFNWDDITRMYNIAQNTADQYVSINDIKLSGPATDVFIAGFGNGVGDETVLFLMEDGTVEYMPLYTAIKNNDYRSYGKVPELTEIIKFYSGGATSAGAMVGGGYQTLAQRADGTFYELYNLLKSTGNYDDSRWQ